MIILTNNSHNLIEINDTVPFTLQKDKKYFLRITTGKFTIKAFIQLYFINPKEDIYICTSNLEYFLLKTRIVKNRILVKREEGKGEREEKYLRMEQEIVKGDSKGKGKDKGGNKGSEGGYKIQGKDKDKGIRGGNKVHEGNTTTSHSLPPYNINPLLVTFSPNIFLSLKSSLLSPSLYFFKENPSSLIFKELFKRKMNFEEINKIGDLKNLIFTRIIIKEGDEYKINPLMMM